MSTMNWPTRIPRPARVALLIAVALTSTACALSNKTKGGAVGATVGAAAGAVVGNNTGSTARGAIIGAVVGGAAGMVIGHQMDKQADELKAEIPNAAVERVGEGIQLTFASGLLYDFDSSAIRSEAATNLRNLAASLNQYPNTELLIVGHTDATGSTDYNQDLSLRRAEAAAAYLEMQGVASSRLHTAGRGESEPVASNGTDSGRQENRRIEVAIYANQAATSGSR